MRNKTRQCYAVGVRSDTELLVLTLIERGVTAVYSLAAQAGLSPGTTLPLLNRLEEAGLIHIGAAGARGRRDCALTPAGRRVLRTEASRLVERPVSDLDSALRTVFLAFPLLENSRRVKFLNDVIARLRTAAESRKLDASSPAVADTPEQYRRLRRLAEAHRLKADVATLEGIVAELTSVQSRRKSRATTPE